MRSFSDAEQALLQRLAVVAREGPLPVERFLQCAHFSEAQGRALILQPQGRFGYLYLRAGRLAQPGTAARERLALVEVWQLLSWLRREGYASISGEEPSATEALCFVGERFGPVRLEKSRIVVNERGEYSDEPNRIVSPLGDPVYDGLRFDGDAFDLAWRHCRGTLVVSAAIEELLPVAPVPPPSSATPAMALPSLASRLRRWLGWRPAGAAAALLSAAGSWWAMSDPAPAADPAPAPAPGAQVSAVPAPTGMTYGLDLSKWDGDWLEHLQGPLEGIGFVYARVSDGLGTDPRFAAHWAALGQRGIARGGYHFYRAGLDVSAQVHHFARLLGPIGEGDLPPAVDVEEASFDTQGVPQQAAAAELLAGLVLLEQLTGRTPMVYTNRDTADRWLRDERFARFPLWVADWSQRQAPRIPWAWRERGHRIWQRTDRYVLPAAGRLALDLDLYAGSVAQLLAEGRSVTARTATASPTGPVAGSAPP